MNLDEELRDTFRFRAASAPDGNTLLIAVRDRSHRADVRRRWFVVMAGLIAVATTVTVAAVRPFAAPAPQPPTTPGPTPTPTPSLPPGTVPIVLAAANISLPAFPFTPGWVPAGLGPRWTGIVGPEARLGYGYGGPKLLSLAVDTVPYDYDWEGSGQTTTAQIGKYSATVRHGTTDSGGPLFGVSWQIDDGRWLTVQSFEIPFTDTIQFARDLRPEPLSASEMPFTLALAPQGFALSLVDPYGLCLAPPTWPPQRRTSLGLCVSVSNDEYQFQPRVDTPVLMAGLVGLIQRGKSGLTLRLELADGRMLQVSTHDEYDTQQYVHISDADLERFVEGVTAR